PTIPWPSRPVGSRLKDFLGAEQCGLVFYPTAGDRESLLTDLFLAIDWLLEQGVLVLVLPPELRRRMRSWVETHREISVFLDSEPPTDILSHQATGVLLGFAGGVRLDDVWPRALRPEGTLIILLPEDAREPHHSVRLLREMWTGPKLTLAHWKEL